MESSRFSAGRRSKREPAIRPFICYYFVLFSAVTYLVFIFLQPVFRQTLVDLGIDVTLVIPLPGAWSYELSITPDDVETLLGGFYAAINLSSAVVSYRIGFVRDRIGLRRWFVAAPLLVGVLLISMAFVLALAFIALFVGWGLVEPTRVLAGQCVNDRVETLGRATVLSAIAMVSALTVIPFQLARRRLSASSTSEPAVYCFLER